MWVVSLDNVVRLFICAPLDRDCSFSSPLAPAFLCILPALKSTLFGQIHLAPAKPPLVENPSTLNTLLGQPRHRQESEGRKVPWRIY